MLLALPTCEAVQQSAVIEKGTVKTIEIVNQN